MIEITKAPVKPAPQEFTYVMELKEGKARLLRGILKEHSHSLTACEILAGFERAGLPTE